MKVLRAQTKKVAKFICRLTTPMSRSITMTLLSVVASLLFTACDKPPCECNFLPAHHIDIRVLDAQGRNLVFGPARRFSADSIGILKTAKDLTIHNASVNRSPDDSASLRLNFYIPAERSFLYYNQQAATDTLDVAWTTKTGRCCGGPQTYQTIESVRFNNISLPLQNGSYLLVK
jgi:hypothetical protein